MDEIKNNIKNTPISLLYLTTKDCNICKVLKPKIKSLISNYNLVQGFYYELDEKPALKGEFSVFAVPTILLFIEGKEALRYSRNIDLFDLKLKIERFIEILK